VGVSSQATEIELWVLARTLRLPGGFWGGGPPARFLPWQSLWVRVPHSAVAPEGWMMNRYSGWLSWAQAKPVASPGLSRATNQDSLGNPSGPYLWGP
jgi:hypothetical protein